MLPSPRAMPCPRQHELTITGTAQDAVLAWAHLALHFLPFGLRQRQILEIFKPICNCRHKNEGDLQLHISVGLFWHAGQQYQKSAVCHTPHYLPDFFLSRKECAVATTPPVASVTAGGNMNINKDALQTGEEGCEHSLSYRYYYSWISIKCSTTAQRHVAVSMRIHPLQPLHRHICTYALFLQLTKPL